MFNDEALELIEDEFIKRIDVVTTELLNKIGNRINDIGKLTATDLIKLQNLANITGDIEKFNKQLEKATALNIKEIEMIYKKSAEDVYKDVAGEYEYQGIKQVPFKENDELVKYYKSMAKITADKFINISNTTGFSSIVNGKVVYSDVGTKYQELVDTAITKMTLGQTTRDEEIRRILKDMADIKTIDYASGYSKRLDSAIRQNVGDGTREVMQGIQKETGKQFGSDGVEISAHSLCATDHQPYQGRQYSHKDFERLQGSLSRIIGGYNCRHMTYEIVLGVSSPAYTDKELQDRIDESNATFEFDDKTYTKYEGTQLQRKLETEIRKQKDLQILAKASGDTELLNQTQTKTNQLTNKYNDLSKVSGLPTKVNRLSVAGYRKSSIVKNLKQKKSLQTVIFKDYDELIDKKEYFDKNINYKEEIKELSKKNIELFEMGNKEYDKAYRKEKKYLKDNNIDSKILPEDVKKEYYKNYYKIQDEKSKVLNTIQSYEGVAEKGVVVANESKNIYEFVKDKPYYDNLISKPNGYYDLQFKIGGIFSYELTEIKAKISLYEMALENNLETSDSPYSFSSYAFEKGGKIDWGSKPENSYRLSNHWNFKSRGEMHCQLSNTEEYIQKMYIAQYRNGKYYIIKEFD